MFGQFFNSAFVEKAKEDITYDLFISDFKKF